MNKTFRLFIIPAAALLTVALPGCKKERAGADAPAQKFAQSQNLAPNFTLPAVSTKSNWELSPLLGKKTVLLAFFTTWCPYCNSSMPYLQSFYEKNTAKDFVVVGIDVGEPESTVANFQKKHGLTFPVLMRGQDDASDAYYQVRYLPTLYLIDKKGQVVRRFEGFHPSMLDEIAKYL